MDSHFYKLRVAITIICLIVALSLIPEEDPQSFQTDLAGEATTMEGELEIIQNTEKVNVVLEETIKQSDTSTETVIALKKVAAPVIKSDENKIVKIVRSNRSAPIVSRSGDSIAIKRQQLLEKRLESITAENAQLLAEKSQPEIIASQEQKLLATQPEFQQSSSTKIILVTATAYCPGTPGSGCPVNKYGHSHCCGAHTDGNTATGRRAIAGNGSKDNPHIIAVDPKIIPLNTLVYLEGYGYAIAADTGSAIKGHKIDILFNKHQDALNFGRQMLKVHFLD